MTGLEDRFYRAFTRYMLGRHRDPDAWAQLRARLAWQYGAERAHEMLHGRDPEMEADIERWQLFGCGP